MKGPEEKEHHASSCSAEWLVDQSRNAMSNGDLYAAKSWLLTAKTLYPKAFAVQYEAFVMEKRTGKLSTCGKLFFEMIKVFPREELLWRELRKLVQSQEINSSDLDTETKFLRDMTESLPLKYQRELLLHYADNQKDLIEKCRISLVVMKKFQGGTKQYGIKLTELLTKAEKDEHSYPLNIYRKMLVCDVLPVILKSSEVQIDAHGIKHKNSVVYIEEATVFNWLELCFEFFVALSINQSTLKYRHLGCSSAAEPNMSRIDPDGDIGQNPWQSLHEVLLLFANKCGWTNVLKIKDKLDPGKSRSIRSKWKVLNNQKDVKSPWGIFYCVLELYYYSVIEYCSKLVIAQTGQPDSDTLEYVLLERSDQLGQASHTQSNLSRPPKKKKKLEDGSASNSSQELQGSVEDVNIHFTSMVSGSNIDLSDFLQVAMDCKSFLMANSLFEKEIVRLGTEWSVHEWVWMDIFNTDSLLYQRKYNEMIELIRDRQMKGSTKGFSSPAQLAKQFTQLSMALYCTGEHTNACEIAIKSINAVSKMSSQMPYDNQTFLASTVTDGRCLQAVPCSKNEIIGYCTELIIHCLKERLPNIEVRPDKDKIGPLYETRNDDVIGQLIVLLQYNWPKGEVLFEQLSKMITTLGGLKYKKFFSYVTNIDILEEFAYLNTLEKVQLELQETIQGESGRKTITRGVNRENKEDFKTAIDERISNDDKSVQDILLTFLKDEEQNLTLIS